MADIGNHSRSAETPQVHTAAPLTQGSGTSCVFPCFLGIGIPGVDNYRTGFRVAHLPFRAVHRRKYTGITHTKLKCQMLSAQYNPKIHLEVQH